MRPRKMNINSVTSVSTHRSAVPTKTFLALWVTALSTTGKLPKTPETERHFCTAQPGCKWALWVGPTQQEESPPETATKKRQEKPCTRNVILRCFRATTVAVLKRITYYIFWVCICSPGYPACNAHKPYCHLWPVRLYNIFPHYLLNGMFYE
jgi:hypothetical protein